MQRRDLGGREGWVVGRVARPIWQQERQIVQSGVTHRPEHIASFDWRMHAEREDVALAIPLSGQPLKNRGDSGRVFGTAHHNREDSLAQIRNKVLPSISNAPRDVL